MNANKMMQLLSDLLGTEIRVEEKPVPLGLPRYLTHGRIIMHASMGECSFWVLQISEKPADSRIAAKELSIYQSVLGEYVTFSYPAMSRAARTAYVKHHIPFMALPDQLYLPFLGCYFSNRFSEQKRIYSVRMTPVTQEVFLFLIYSPRRPYAKSEIAEQLGINPAYITRASDQLTEMGLISTKKQGKYSYIERTDDGMGYLKKAEPYLIDPVKEVCYIKRLAEPDNLPLAGECALSLYGMINPPAVEIRACPAKSEIGKSLAPVQEPSWEEEETILKIEKWKYDPGLFCTDNRVDIVSLYCSLSSIRDERVQKDLEDALEAYEWQ